MHNKARAFKLTRIAPTPSGYLHLGNALSFTLTAAIASASGAGVLLRIDDLDRERVEQAYLDDIFETLEFLNIPWQQGPRNTDEFKKGWSQLSRLELYKPALELLAQTNMLFACTCSRKQMQTPGYKCTCGQKKLPLDTPDAAWRLLTDNQPLKINTLTNGTIELPLPNEMHNFIVRKKDGYPAYQLTSLLDDVHFGVDLVVRGEDLWPSTVAQHYLAIVLGLETFSNSSFHHHALITIDDGAKLSKSAGSTSIQYVRRHSITPADVYGKIAGALLIEKPCFDLADISNNLKL